MRVLTFSVLRQCRAQLWRPLSRALCTQPELAVGSVLADPNLVEVHSTWPQEEQPELRAETLQGMRVLPDFVTEAEETALLAELEPVLKRMRYEFDHWDNAIQGYRETERGKWSPTNEAIMERIRSTAFPGAGADSRLLPTAHVLDLAAAGHIKPHIDAVRFCGGIIAGLCLMSSAVMRLIHEKQPHLRLDALLQRRALYIMSGVSRYSYTHEVLGGEDSVWRGERLSRRRRVAVILRSQPRPDRN